MSERDIELTRAATEAFNTRDIEAYIAFCDPTIEFHSALGAAVGGSGAVYHGHDGLRSWDRDLREAWGDEIRLEPEAHFDLGEQTLSFWVLHGRGTHSGVEVAMLGAQVSRWREGLMIYVKGYADRNDALRDLGVSADELEPIAP